MLRICFIYFRINANDNYYNIDASQNAYYCKFILLIIQERRKLLQINETYSKAIFQTIFNKNQSKHTAFICLIDFNRRKKNTKMKNLLKRKAALAAHVNNTGQKLNYQTFLQHS